MNRFLDGSQELVVVDNASTDSPEVAAAGWKGPHRFIGLTENVGFGAASNVGVATAATASPCCSTPTPSCSTTASTGSRRRPRELGGLVGPRVLNPDRTVQPSASGPEVGAWPWVRALVPAALQPAAIRARTEPYRLERRLEVSWLTGSCVAGPTDVLARLGPFDPALHMFGEDVDLGLRAAAAGVTSWFDPEACRIVHHGQGSSTRAYGSREGWRPTGTLNWRAAVRRAYGPRREWLGWLALRIEPAPAPGRQDGCSDGRPSATAPRSRRCSPLTRRRSCRPPRSDLQASA